MRSPPCAGRRGYSLRGVEHVPPLHESHMSEINTIIQYTCLLSSESRRAAAGERVSGMDIASKKREGAWKDDQFYQITTARYLSDRLAKISARDACFLLLPAAPAPPGTSEPPRRQPDCPEKTVESGNMRGKKMSWARSTCLRTIVSPKISNAQCARLRYSGQHDSVFHCHGAKYSQNRKKVCDSGE